MESWFSLLRVSAATDSLLGAVGRIKGGRLACVMTVEIMSVCAACMDVVSCV